MNGTTVKDASVSPNVVGAEWTLEGVADLDGNGKTDLFWRHNSRFETVTWLMNGMTPVQGGLLPASVPLNWKIEGFGDFSGDGNADVLWRNTNSGEVVAWMFGSSPSGGNVQIIQGDFLSHQNQRLSQPLEWQAIGIDDFTGDSNLDIVWRHGTTGEIIVWEINGLRMIRSITFSDASLRNLSQRAIGTTNRPVIPTLPVLETTPPTVEIALANDTGTVGDRITRVPTINGRIVDQGGLLEVFASLNDRSFINILSWLAPDGTVTLDQTQLGTLFGGAITDGSYQLRIRAKDRSGNLTSTVDTPFRWTLDTTAPTATLNLDRATDTGRRDDDFRTSSQTPRFFGTVESGAQLQLWFNDVPISPTIHNGSWQINAPILSDNAYRVRAVAIDQAGNSQEIVLPSSLVIDTQTVTPTISQVAASTSGAVNQRTVSGTAEADAIVSLYAGTVLIGTAQTDADGRWQLETSVLNDGSYPIVAKAIDVAGNESAASAPLVVAIGLKPNAPQNVRLLPETDSGASSTDNITRILQPKITGTAATGTTIKLYRDNQVIGQTLAGSTGDWTIPLIAELPSGRQTLQLTASNAIGESAATGFEFVIDAIRPTLSLQLLNADQLNAIADGVTIGMGSRLLGTVEGTGSGVSRLTYQLGDLLEREIQVSADGLFNQLIDLSGAVSGTNTLTLSVIDVAGNVQTQTYTIAVDVRPVAPEAPGMVARLRQDTGASATDGWTTTPEILGVLQGGIGTLEIQLMSGTFTSEFVDIASLLNANGTFTINEARLASLYGGELGDGSYTVQLRSMIAGTTTNQSVQFNLDRTTPETIFIGMTNGTEWERGKPLEAQVKDKSEIAIEYWFETTEGTRIDGRTVSVTNEELNHAVPEFAAENSTLQKERPYDLVMTSTDLAGNQQRSRFQFFLKSDRRVVDDDLWEEPPSDDPPNPDPELPGYVGPGGGWGSWGNGGFAGDGGGVSRIGSGGFAISGDTDGDGDPDQRIIVFEGCGYEYSYYSSVSEIVETAVDSISFHPQTVHKKAALHNRRNLLDAIASRIERLIWQDGDFRNDQSLIDRFQPVMEGLFVDAYDPRGEDAGVSECYAPWAGRWLAQELVRDERSVRVQVFQATLLAVVTEVLKDHPVVAESIQHQQLVDAVLELGKTYAWLNPDAETAIPIEDKDFAFLNQLWRLQMPDASGSFAQDASAVLQQSVEALTRLLTSVDDPARAIEFISRLIVSATYATALKEGTTPDIKNQTFLRELNEFGFVAARVNLRTTLEAPKAGEFLEALWQGRGLSIAHEGLNDFFSGTVERVKLMNYAERLVQATQQVQGLNLQTQKKDPRFLSHLLNLGSAYVALHLKEIGSNATDPKLFLNTLWQGQNLQKGATELETYLAQFEGNDLNLLKGSSNLLRVLNSISNPYIQSEIQDVVVTRNWLHEFAFHANLKLALREGEIILNPGDFHNAIWEASAANQQRSLAEQLYRFINPNEILVASNSDELLIAQDVWEGVQGGLGSLLGGIVTLGGGVLYFITDASGKIIRTVFHTEGDEDDRTEGQKKTQEAVGELLQDAVPTDQQGRPLRPGQRQKGIVDNYVKEPGNNAEEAANRDFDRFAGKLQKTPKDQGGGKRSVDLPDGGSAGVYPTAKSTGEPSIQINLNQGNINGKTTIKIRYSRLKATLIIPIA
ncbi:Ig-like domain-containing protein [Leptolyngbya sp. NIES-2104]|uniref:Ig-like domain-containing protein n=1 Tax=Leptolyngbya sp. NIES-2104 TaxID=1552121 RepID=UPI0006EC55FA|nr:Ig-like domain-containing protein [Leptolyngbya sp. NIES-2104]GAQ00079.1 hypothetical protein NIES2104_66440 [Leptolyngbya sp. NIES-2104]